MFSRNCELKSIVAIIFISHLTFEVTPASPAHIHSIHKERVEDGSFVHRDHNHIVEGEHHSEFDHEAIIGGHSVNGSFKLWNIFHRLVFYYISLNCRKCKRGSRIWPSFPWGVKEKAQNFTCEDGLKQRWVYWQKWTKGLDIKII